MVKDGIVGKAALLILTPGTFWRRCRGVDEQGPRRAMGARFTTPTGDGRRYTVKRSIPHPLLRPPQAMAGRWSISVVWRMARKILENTRLRQAKRLENATAWQMGLRFGASCRRACEGVAGYLKQVCGRLDEQAGQEHDSLSDALGWSTRAAEVLTYADVWGDGWRRQEQARGHNAILRSQGREQPRMDSTGGHGSRSGRQGTEDSRSSRPDERAGQQGSTAGEQAKRGRAAMPGRASGCPENGQARPWRS